MQSNVKHADSIDCLSFTTKAGNLANLAPRLGFGKVLPLFVVFYKEWREAPAAVLAEFAKEAWVDQPLIVRSSSSAEDQHESSCAGQFESLLNIPMARLENAINRVFESYGDRVGEGDHVLIQPMLQDVRMSGVLFTKDPSTNAPYYIVNYDLEGDTEAVTSGKKTLLHTSMIAKSTSPDVTEFSPLVQLAQELETIFNYDALDIEFGITKTDEVFLFQVRPLILKNASVSMALEEQRDLLKGIAQKINQQRKVYPYLYGNRTILGIMPDWNPAEIIGVRPKPLALSLYKEIITDSTWAYQRDNYGYKNLRGFPLLLDYYGLPYIDVRVSFNSFLPKELDDDLSERLVNYYLDRLEENPELHDKVEFDIVYSCYTFDLPERVQKLKGYGFSEQDITLLKESLRKLTNNIIHQDKGLWVEDTAKIKILEDRHKQIYFNQNLDTLSKIYWLIEDCKRYGTLPFAGLARAGFIAIQILNSMVAIGVLSAEQRNAFLNSLKTVSSQITEDMNILDKAHFLEKYGHLRPGTYDISSPRYDEFSDVYFHWEGRDTPKFHEKLETFLLSFQQLKSIEKFLEDHGLDNNIVGLFTFLKAAIEGREYAKFIFTKNLSDVLGLIKGLSQEYGLPEEDLPFLDIKPILSLYGSLWNAKNVLSRSIEEGKKAYAMTAQILLPPVIVDAMDVFAFQYPQNKPNFITLKKITAPVVRDLSDPKHMEGAIVFIASADPGFDWIFTHNIAGFITAYGGVNSHMAIRAGELGLPAIVGSGENLYNQWSQANTLYLDCENQIVQVLS